MNINELKDVVKQVVKESSLSRIQQHISQHECAIITAFRGDPTDGLICRNRIAPSTFHSNETNTKKINILNNRDLKAKLLDSGYGVTDVDGSYVEDFGTEIANEVKEDSLFVVNLSDDPNFADAIESMGQRYCQDSVLIIPMGGKQPYFLGTNHSNFPGFQQTIKLGNITYGRESQFMTKVRNRPTTILPSNGLDEGLQTFKKLSRLEKMAVRAIAQTIK